MFIRTILLPPLHRFPVPGWADLEQEETSPENESSRGGPVPGDSSQQIPEKAKSALPNSGAVILLFAFFLSLGPLSSAIAWSL